jgi:hypothetical protein
MELVLHKQTSQQVEAFLAQPVHAVLIEGQAGSGKGRLAAYLASSLLGLSEDALASHSFFLRIEPKGTISIDTIRSIQDFVKLKTIGNQPFRRAIIIENAQTMTTEAQNAFLKLLEEPPKDTVIILTATSNQSLLPTIYSRVQKIQVKIPEKTSLIEFFSNYEEPEVSRAYYMSGGQIGLMHALLNKNNDHPLSASINEAKDIFKMGTLDRLVNVDRWSKNKDQLPDLLQALSKVCHAVLVQATEKNNEQQIKKSHHVLKHITKAQGLLKHNPNTKLLLTDLMLNI